MSNIVVIGDKKSDSIQLVYKHATDVTANKSKMNNNIIKSYLIYFKLQSEVPRSRVNCNNTRHFLSSIG